MPGRSLSLDEALKNYDKSKDKSRTDGTGCTEVVELKGTMMTDTSLPVPHPRCYWVEPGVFLAGTYPGAPDADEARVKIAALLGHSVGSGGGFASKLVMAGAGLYTVRNSSAPCSGVACLPQRRPPRGHDHERRHWPNWVTSLASDAVG